MNVRSIRPLVGLLVLSAPGSIAAAFGPAAPPNEAASTSPAVPPLVLDDVPEILVPDRPRTEAEEDRIEAVSQFAAARTLEGKREFARALRHYQRALRFDPHAPEVTRSIVHLALGLRHLDEAARYALKLQADDLKATDSHFLVLLGERLAGQKDWTRAATLYEMVLAAGTVRKDFEILVRMELGRLYHLAEQYDKAADNFARVVDALEQPEEAGPKKKEDDLLSKDPGSTYHLFGESFLLADRLDEAVAAFKKAHQLEPDQALLEFDLARVHARKGQPAKALDRLQAAFQAHLDGEGIAPYELLAEVLDKLGRKDDLTGQLEKLHRDDPDAVPLGYFLAGQYREAEDFHKAEKMYLALAKDSPTPTGYRSLVEIFRKTKRHQQLLAILGEAVGRTGTLETLGEEGRAVSGDAELVQTLLDIARNRIQADAEKVDYGTRLAVALLALQNKQFDAAEEFFELALDTQPEKQVAAELLLAWGLELFFEERPAEAAKVFQRAVDDKVLPDDRPLFHSYLARALAASDQLDRALDVARKTIELKEDAPRFYGTLAWVWYRSKRNDEAIEAYADLVEKFDSKHVSLEDRRIVREARLTLSHLCVLQEDLPQAEEWLAQVLDEFPEDVGASNDLGYLWADQGKHLHRALKMIQLAVDAEPDNMAYRDSLGWVYYRLGRHQEAVAELKKAVAAAREGRQPDAVILDHLGDAYLQVKQLEKAKEAWGKAVELFKKEEEPEKAKALEKKINDQG